MPLRLMLHFILEFTLQKTVTMPFKDTYQIEKAFNEIFPEYQWPFVETENLSFDIGKSIMAYEQNHDDCHFDEKEEVTGSSNYFFMMHFDDDVKS